MEKFGRQCLSDLINKRDAGNPILNTLGIGNLSISEHARYQQVSAYNCSFVLIIQSYDCNQVPIGLLHAEKMAEVVLLNVFRIGFPVFLLMVFLDQPFAKQYMSKT